MSFSPQSHHFKYGGCYTRSMLHLLSEKHDPSPPYSPTSIVFYPHHVQFENILLDLFNQQRRRRRRSRRRDPTSRLFIESIIRKEEDDLAKDVLLLRISPSKMGFVMSNCLLAMETICSSFRLG